MWMDVRYPLGHGRNGIVFSQLAECQFPLLAFLVSFSPFRTMRVSDSNPHGKVERKERPVLYALYYER